MISAFSFTLSFIVFGVSIYCLPLSQRSELDFQHEWNLLVLTQSWPPAVCTFLENQGQKCNISSEIKSWVIHGLWPTKSGSEGPNFCNDSWKFDLSKVEVLRPTLDYNWPSVASGVPSQKSWTHEWEKHGTCGTSLPVLKDELHYFNATLGLHEHYNLSQLLMHGGVIPSNARTYKAKDILKILQNSLGVTPTISCVKDRRGSPRYYLEQIEICLNKSFQPVDCTNSFTPRGSHSDLLFRSEASNLRALDSEEISRGNIEDCGEESDDVYFKPMSSGHISVSIQ